MFSNLGWGETAVLVLLALLIFGPEKLPTYAAQAGRLVRQLRQMANGVTSELRAELGSDFDDLRSLDPRRLLDDSPEPRTARGSTPAVAAGGPPLDDGERPPYDADAT